MARGRQVTERAKYSKGMQQRLGANFFDLIPDELLLKVVVPGRNSLDKHGEELQSRKETPERRIRHSCIAEPVKTSLVVCCGRAMWRESTYTSFCTMQSVYGTE
jgi:hypothetical protein